VWGGDQSAKAAQADNEEGRWDIMLTVSSGLRCSQVSAIQRMTLAVAAVVLCLGSQSGELIEGDWVSRLNQYIIEFVETHDDYPVTLEDLCGNLPASKCESGRDVWGQPYWYRPLAGGYELFSSGRDRLPWTDDDIPPGRWWGRCLLVWVGTEWKELAPEPRGTMPSIGLVPSRAWGPRQGWAVISLDPRDVAGMELYLLERGLVSRQVDKRLPQSLEVPGKLGIGGRRAEFNRYVDPWGSRYHYEALDQGFDLYSYGPDRVPDTEDDVWPNDKSERCMERPVLGVQSAAQNAGQPPRTDVAARRARSLQLAERWREVRCSSLGSDPRRALEYNRVCVSGGENVSLPAPERAKGGTPMDTAASMGREPETNGLPLDAVGPDSELTGSISPVRCGCSFVGAK